jgi:hypothetical protein
MLVCICVISKIKLLTNGHINLSSGFMSGLLSIEHIHMLQIRCEKNACRTLRLRSEIVDYKIGLLRALLGESVISRIRPNNQKHLDVYVQY